MLAVALTCAVALSSWPSLSTGAAGATPDLGQYVLPVQAKEPPAEAWKWLEHFSHTMTRSEFETLWKSVYDPAGRLASYADWTDGELKVYATADKTVPPVAVVSFAADDSHRWPLPVGFRPADSFKGSPNPSKPLAGLRVAIDPADIGGDYGVMEDRSTTYPGYGLIQEGDLNLMNALLLKQKLEALGATVRLSREKPVPVMAGKPQDYVDDARDLMVDAGLLPEAYRHRADGLSSSSQRRLEIASEVVFTKTYETRARAAKVMDGFVPDITIVLQHNATEASTYARTAKINRNIFFVNGAYMKGEVDDPRQRFQMLQKLFEQGIKVEVPVARAISSRFQKSTGYPPVMYGDSSSTRLLDADNFYFVARNIAVSREYPGPVVVVEPYFMNEPGTLRRLLAGDYTGKKEVAGKEQCSIYQEYTDAVVAGLLDVYAGVPAVASSPSGADKGTEKAAKVN